MTLVAIVILSCVTYVAIVAFALSLGMAAGRSK